MIVEINKKNKATREACLLNYLKQYHTQDTSEDRPHHPNVLTMDESHLYSAVNEIYQTMVNIKNTSVVVF